MIGQVEKTSEFYEQIVYINRVKAKLTNVYGESPKATVITFGCQQNVSDSEKLKGMLFSMGYTIVEDMEEADFIIFNTCAVRGHAEDRVYGNIGKVKALKKDKPDLIAAVCGCMAQQQSVADKIKKSYPYIDLVFGTQVFHRLPFPSYTPLKKAKKKDILSDVLNVGITYFHGPSPGNYRRRK